MVRRLLLIAASAASVAVITLPAKAVDLQPGQWEVSTKRERDGVVTQRPMRATCITPEKAKQITEEIGKALPTSQTSTRSTTCQILDRKTTDKEVTWRMQCTGLFPAEQTGRYVVDSPQHYTSTVHSSVKVNQKTLSSTLTTEGRRIGECPK